MKNEDTNLPISSEIDLESLKKDDKLFQVSFENEYNDETDECTLSFKETTFVFDGWAHTHVDVKNKQDYLANIHDIRFPKVNMKIDLREGFFKSHKEAAAAIVDCMSEMARLAKETFEKQYGDK